MRELYSRVQEGVLLHVINKADEVTGHRHNLSPNREFLQVAALRLSKEQTFKPHRHIEQQRVTDITQESWVVIQGKVRATLYDLDNTILAEPLLGPGDCSVTFRGGHTYTILEPDTLVYEFKTGPYNGQSQDKVFI